MSQKMQITKPRLVACCFACIMPLLAICFGIVLLIQNWLFNATFLVVMALFPVAALAGLCLVIFSRKRVLVKTIFVTLILLTFSIVFLIGFAIGHFEELSRYKGEDAVETYESAAQRSLMPDLDEIGQPQEIEYVEYYSSGFLFFVNDVHTLICRYLEPEYEVQKALLNESYTFQSAPMTAHKYSCDPTVTIGNYLFRTLAIDGTYGDEIYYPKYLYFVATNDQTREIIYLSTCDDDIDYIQSLEQFLKDDCGWDHIR